MMKKTVLLLLLSFQLGNSSIAQTSIPFKTSTYTIQGLTAGKIKNVYEEGATLECFWDIDQETRTVVLTTVEILQNEAPDNNTNIQKEAIVISDIDLNAIPEVPMEEYNLDGTSYYSVTISSDNAAFKVVKSYCSVSSPTSEFIQEKPGFSFTIKFSNKEFATQFLSILNEELLN